MAHDGGYGKKTQTQKCVSLQTEIRGLHVSTKGKPTRQS